MIVIAVYGDGYDQACDWLYDGNHAVYDALNRLSNALAGSYGMAGNDQSGRQWAADYDKTAGRLADAGGQLCDALARAAALTNTSLANHRGADAASVYAQHTPPKASRLDTDPTHYGEGIYFGVPTAKGDNGGGPSWWHWIAGHTKGWLWPNADTDRLRTVGAAWRTAGEAIQRSDIYATSAADSLGTERSPEIAVATKALNGLGRYCDTIGGAFVDLGNACDDYATLVEATRHQIQHQAKRVLNAITGTAGDVLSILTAGLGGAAAEIRDAGEWVAEILADLDKAVRDDALDRVAHQVEQVVPGLEKFVKADQKDADLTDAAAEAEGGTVSPNPLEQGAAKVPAAWGSGVANTKGVGTRWFDPADKGNGIRIDRGEPGSPFPSQRVDHVIVRKGGRILGPDGKPIVGSLKQNPDAHIPLSDWLNWTSWDTP